MSTKHRGVASWSIRRPVGTLMITSVVIVLGALFLGRLPLDLLPRIVYPQVRVNVSYPGVEPQVLEETVAKPLERALATTEDLTLLETEVQEGRVGVNLHFRYGTDVDFALQDASKNLERARASLPIDVEPPSIRKADPSQIPIYEVAFYSDGRDLVALRSWVEERLAPQLLTIEGVASVDIAGGLIREVQVVLDQERLRARGFTVSDVVTRLRDANRDVAGGRVGTAEREVLGKTAGKFQSVAEIRGLPLVTPAGAPVPLGEVAEVRDTHQEQRLWARMDGVPAVKLSLRKQPDANTVTVADAVADRLAGLESSRFVPGDVRFQMIQSQAEFIRASVASVRDAALLGAGLAMLVVLIFLKSLRKTLVIGVAIPFAILGTFALMGMADLTLNVMSLGGLALGVGMLVDNSIVMLENIFRRRDEEGLDPETAADEGAAEVSSAVVASTLTNLAAVVPFLLISGLAALIFRELILTISFAIGASLVVALTLVPMLAAQLGKLRFSSGLERARPLLAVERGVDAVRARYRVAAAAALRRRGWVLAGAVAALALALMLTRNLGSEFLPQVDDGGVGAYVGLPPGASAEETDAVVRRIEAMVREMPGVEHVFATAGGFLFGGATAQRSGRGSLDIRLVSASEREMTADEWVQELQRRIDEAGFPGARVFVRPPRIRGLRTSTSGSPIELTVQGDDLATLQQIARVVEERLRGVPGLENLEAGTEDASPQLQVRLDRERAAWLDLDVAEVGETVRTALDGTIATRYTEGNREYDVRVMFPRERFRSPEDLESIALFPGSGAGAVYLRDVATVTAGLGPTDIQRENQNRILRLSGDVVAEVASVGEVNDSIRARLAALPLPDGYGIIIGGEEESIRENNRQLAVVVALAVFLVFVVMAVQYESVVNPLVIMLAMPLSLIGVSLALWITGTPLSAPVLLGVILLAGIVVNNAILLVEYVEDYRRAGGVRMEQAVVDAGAVRLRPILMTTLTTLSGMLPLALGLGDGSELMQPLAIVVIGGLALSTLLTLFVVPCAYVTFNRLGERVSRWLTGRVAGERPAAPLAEPARREGVAAG